METQIISFEDQNDDLKSYSNKRKKIKNGIFATTIILFKSTVGVGLIANQMYYFSTGYILATILGIIVSMVICYTMILAVSVADQIEEKDPSIDIENLDELALYTFSNNKLKKGFYISKKLYFYLKIDPPISYE